MNQEKMQHTKVITNEDDNYHDGEAKVTPRTLTDIHPILETIDLGNLLSTPKLEIVHS